MTQEEIRHFETLGFIQYKGFFSPAEVDKLSSAFDSAMERARGGAPAPVSGEPRQQVVPFFDYDSDTFYPLLDNERIMDVFSTLMGEDFILTVSEGILHTGGSAWHHDACGPEGFFSMRAAMYLDPLGPEDGCLNVIPGSHLEGLATHDRATSEKGALPALLAVEADVNRAVAVPVKAGYAMVHHCMTLHQTNPNPTPRERRAMVIHYMPAGTRNGRGEVMRDNLLLRGEQVDIPNP